MAKKKPESIICPSCGSIERAFVDATIPWNTYIHHCVNCNYIIGESEWNTVQVLYLTLFHLPFQVMLLGEKDIEFRRDSKFIRDRLLNKDGSIKRYDFVNFKNGYQANAPEFTCKYIATTRMRIDIEYKYSNGFSVSLSSDEPTWFIILGEVIHSKNLKPISKQQLLL